MNHQAKHAVKSEVVGQTQKVMTQIQQRMGCVRCGMVATSPRGVDVTTGSTRLA